MLFKGLAAPKRRLAPVLSLAERRELAAAMLADVLGALSAARGLSRVVLVSRDPLALESAACWGAEPLPDGGAAGYRAAAEQVARVALEAGAAGLLVIPADVPLLTAVDVERLLAASISAAVAIVADRHGEGTNALVTRPPNAIPFRFGRHSFEAHRRAADQRALRPLVLDLPNLSLDLDRPDDLRTLLARDPAPHRTATARYLVRIGAVARLAAPTDLAGRTRLPHAAAGLAAPPADSPS